MARLEEVKVPVTVEVDWKIRQGAGGVALCGFLMVGVAVLLGIVAALAGLSWLVVLGWSMATGFVIVLAFVMVLLVTPKGKR